MNRIKHAFVRIGYRRLETALDRGQPSVSQAVIAGQAPSGWAPTLKRLAAESDPPFRFPADLIRWTAADDAAWFDQDVSHLPELDFEESEPEQVA